MSCTTINLTTIEPDVSQPMLDLEFIYGEERIANSYVHLQYQKHRQHAAKNLNDWFCKINTELIRQLDIFLTKSMDMNEDSLFYNKHSNLINGATLITGMNASDNVTTLDLIEQHVYREYENIKTFRLGSEYVKRAHFIDLMYDIREHANVLIIIEQLEKIDTYLIKIFINILHDLLTEKELELAMVLFGTSSEWTNLGSMLPIGTLNRIKILETIVKDTNKVTQVIEEKLLSVDQYDTRLGPKLLDSIYFNVHERDTSFANFSYLFQHCLLEHSLLNKAILKLPKKQLTEIISSEPRLIAQLKQYESLANTSYINLKSSPEKVADFCIKCIRDFKTYFKFLWSQIHCYFLLLKDETCNVFPSHTFDIYEEIVENQHLGESKMFTNAIISFSKLPTDKLLKRLNSCFSDAATLDYNDLNEKDIRSKLMRLRDKIINNDEPGDIINELKNELLNHSQSLTNPMRLPLSELIYFDNHKSVMQLTLPTTRLDASNSFIDDTSCFGLLYGLIHNGPEEISLNDLYGDFSSALDKTQILKPKECRRKLSHLKLKTTTKRRTRSLNIDIDKNKTTTLNSNLESTELKKMIFVDFIIYLEYQGLIIIDTRRSKRGNIRRSVWL